MNTDSCDCVDCAYSDNKSRNAKRAASSRTQLAESSEPKVKLLKSIELNSNLNTIPHVGAEPKKMAASTKLSTKTERSRRCLYKTLPKKSISCEDFMQKYADILRSRSNQNAYQISHRIIALVQLAFPLDLKILGESFLVSPDESADESTMRLNLKGIREIFSKLRGLWFSDVNACLRERMRLIMKCLLSKPMSSSPQNTSKLVRIVALVLESPANAVQSADEKGDNALLDAFFSFVGKQKGSFRSKLTDLLSTYSERSMRDIVKTMQKNVNMFCCLTEHKVKHSNLDGVLSVLSIMREASSKRRIVAESAFENAYLSEIFVFEQSNLSNPQKCETIAKYPWLLGVKTKKLLLKIECFREQYRAEVVSVKENSGRTSNRRAPQGAPASSARRIPLQPIEQRAAVSINPYDGDIILDSQLYSYDELPPVSPEFVPRQAESHPPPEIRSDNLLLSQFCYFAICREHVTVDALRFLERYSTNQLKKKLKIAFIRENGVDEGGLKNEFFELLTKDLLNSEHGLFVANSESNCTWFSTNWTSDSREDYEFCGTIIALALYNGVMLDLQFPLAFYKHIIGEKVRFDDLADFSPELKRGLQCLLDFDGSVEETFCRHFEASYSCFGREVVKELVPNGRAVPVTNNNRKEFVDLYTSWVLCRSVSRQIEAFKKGFDRIFKSRDQWILKILSPHELRLCLCGTETLDFSKWKQKTTLTGYKWTDPTIRNFWRLVDKFGLEEKRKLLLFVTGCVRAPINGLSELPLRIIRGESTDMLPTSRTCFNQLVLPPYETRAKLKEKLMLALENSLGFGLQ